tara:strand:+ start:5332 stop:5808 length:477 start_codon:yes stop_codon:yes gene_type:complete
MAGCNENATIYLIEDINDLRYVGSTSEKRFQDRLHTHRRDKKDCKNNCSSASLNLSYCNIVKLKDIKNTREQRDYWESHYINNVYPECVNINRFNKSDRREYEREYYKKNKQRIIERVKKYKEQNKDKLNERRRLWYTNNKERLRLSRAEKTKKKVKS